MILKEEGERWKWEDRITQRKPMEIVTLVGNLINSTICKRSPPKKCKLYCGKFWWAICAVFKWKYSFLMFHQVLMSSVSVMMYPGFIGLCLTKKCKWKMKMQLKKIFTAEPQMVVSTPMRWSATSCQDSCEKSSLPSVSSQVLPHILSINSSFITSYEALLWYPRAKRAIVRRLLSCPSLYDYRLWGSML